MVLDVTNAGVFTLDLFFEAQEVAHKRTGEFADQIVLTPEQKADLYQEVGTVKDPMTSLKGTTPTQITGTRVYSTEDF